MISISFWQINCLISAQELQEKTMRDDHDVLHVATFANWCLTLITRSWTAASSAEENPVLAGQSEARTLKSTPGKKFSR